MTRSVWSSARRWIGKTLARCTFTNTLYDRRRRGPAWKPVLRLSWSRRLVTFKAASSGARCYAVTMQYRAAPFETAHVASTTSSSSSSSSSSLRLSRSAKSIPRRYPELSRETLCSTRCRASLFSNFEKRTHSEQHNCIPMAMKNCRSFQLVQLCQKRSRNDPFGLVLMHEACDFVPLENRKNSNALKDFSFTTKSSVVSKIEIFS